MIGDANVAAAVALEQELGDPYDPERPFSFRRALEDDEAERFPAEACALLDAAGLPARYVPEAWGGRLGEHESLFHVVRMVARRDLTVIIGHAKTYLGAVAVWVAGSDAQRRALGAEIAAGMPVSLALTEREHGSDLLASGVTARRQRSGWSLSGEKWLINNATRGGALTVLAQSDPDGGFRRCSFFLVRKAELAPATFEHLPKIRTLGIRGADISGLRLRDATVGDAALVGAPGQGLEIAIKLLQLTRTACSALSLGAADTALRLTLDFVRARRLYDKSVWELPHARQTLVDVFVDQLACECLGVMGARAIHALPEEMSLHSAATKFFVPTQIEDCVTRLARILGARFYLREEHAWGAFQKLLRDHLLVGLFDGSSIVNLHALGLLLRRLPEPTAIDPRLAHACRLDAPLPPFDPARLEVTARRNALEDGLPEAVAALECQGDAELAALGGRVRDALMAVRAEARALHAEAPAAFSRSAALFDVARRYATLHAAAACVHVFVANRARGDDFFAAGDWLAAALARLLRASGSVVPAAPPARSERLAARLEALHDGDRLFSIRPIALAPRSRR